MWVEPTQAILLIVVSMCARHSLCTKCNYMQYGTAELATHTPSFERLRGSRWGCAEAASAGGTALLRTTELHYRAPALID